MGIRGNIRRSTNSYTQEQIRVILKELGVRVASATRTDIICYCPFHYNVDTPAFAVGIRNGLYYCFQPACEAHTGGTLEELVQRFSDRDEFATARYIAKKAGETQQSLAQLIDEALEEKTLRIIPQAVIDERKQAFWDNAEAQEYMYGRGFNNITLDYFDVGWDDEQQLVVIPFHDPDGQPVGLNGRSIVDKRFHITKNAPRNQVLCNLHNAKRFSNVIITESHFDMMRIHQAGYPNVVNPLGASISATQYALLERYFERIYLFMDNPIIDEAGAAAAHALIGALPHIPVYWCRNSAKEFYPKNVKDATDMSDEEIKACVENSVPDRMILWDIGG